MILIFDLDDTLYKEMDFIKSGFNAVSDYLSETYSLPATYQRMFDIFSNEGRGQIFDKILIEYNRYSVKKVQKCISVYRYHKPNIKLYDSAEQCLQRFSFFHKYIVTDGNKLVQANKIDALNIKHLFTGIYITRKYGIDKEKPSSYCFEKIQKKESVSSKDIIYIGDNINKDFIDIKKLGFRTVRIRQGFYKDINLREEYEAEFTVSSLDELNTEFLSNMEG